VQIRALAARPLIAALFSLSLLAGCAGTQGSVRVAGNAEPATVDAAAAQPAGAATASASASASAPASAPAAAAPAGPPAGNPNGKAAVPADARPVDTSKPTRVIGNGNPASCTSEAVVSAVAAGGIITFNCGAAPKTITMKATAKVRNANGPRVVLDGGGKVTLSGEGQRRILYMNTCDAAQGHTTSHCQDQDHPQLTVQNLTFAEGNSTGERAEGGGGGAIFVRGGRFKAVNSRFLRNRCDGAGPDLGGAAIRVLSQSKGLPVYIVNSTFEGGVCSNGGALSSIGVSWMVINSVFSRNSAIGKGANPSRPGTSGGGSGGAIYTDGDRFTVTLAGTVVENNKANEGGGAIFFVSNNRTGTMTIENSRLKGNPSAGFETDGLPGIFFLGARRPATPGSTLQK
jgi:hypothetical protein